MWVITPETDKPDKKNYPHALSDVAIRALKPLEKEYKVFDGGCKGLYLVVTPSGSLLWRLRYWFKSVRKTLALGVYPAVGLKDARRRVADARTLLANGPQRY